MTTKAPAWLCCIHIRPLQKRPGLEGKEPPSTGSWCSIVPGASRLRVRVGSAVLVLWRESRDRTGSELGEGNADNSLQEPLGLAVCAGEGVVRGSLLLADVSCCSFSGIFLFIKKKKQAAGRAFRNDFLECRLRAERLQRSVVGLG